MTDEQKNQVNRRILNSELRHLDGTSVQKPITQAFLSADEHFAYVVEDGIILLLTAFAIVLRPEEPAPAFRLARRKGSRSELVQRVRMEGWRGRPLSRQSGIRRS